MTASPNHCSDSSASSSDIARRPRHSSRTAVHLVWATVSCSATCQKRFDAFSGLEKTVSISRTADLIESEMRRGGGIMTREDLRQYQAVWRAPVAFQYRDHTVISMPPPSSGGATIAEI